MKRKTLTLTLSLFLLVSVATGLSLANFANADPEIFNRSHLPELAIKSDGTVNLDTGHITRIGNIYTLTGDVDGYAVVIECSNIIFDGAGHSINASSGHENAGLRLLGVNNVTIKNLVSDDYSTKIHIGATNCTIKNVTVDVLYINTDGSNTITESNIKKLTLWQGNSLVSKCNISSVVVADWSASVFTRNNFFINNITEESFIWSSNFWDNSSVGNYWSDYLTRYPNASEIGHTGIGDTPYVLDDGNIDHYPLMYPYDVERDQIALPDPPPQADAGIAPSTILIVGASTITVIGVTAILLYYHKRKSSKANRLVPSPFEGQEKSQMEIKE